MSNDSYEKSEFDLDNILKEFSALPDEPTPEPPIFERSKRISPEVNEDGTASAVISDGISGSASPAELGFDAENVKTRFDTRPDPKQDRRIDPNEVRHRFGSAKRRTTPAKSAEPDISPTPAPDPVMDEVDRIIREFRHEDAPENPTESPASVPESAEEPIIEPEPEAPADVTPAANIPFFDAEAPEPTKKRPERAEIPEVEPEPDLYEGSGLSDDTTPDYASSGDYSVEQTSQAPKAERPRRSFREAVAIPVISALAFVAMRIKQSQITIGPASYEDEDLGEETEPDKAAKFYDRHIAGLRIRARISFVLCAVMIYISLGLPLSGALADIGIRSAVCLIMMLAVMICGLDIITTGIMSLVRFKFHASSLIAVSCLLCMIDAFLSAANVGQKVIPFCVIPSLTIACTLLGCIMNARSNRIVFNTAHSARSPYTLTAESELVGGDITLVKARGTAAGIVRRTEEEGPDEAVFGVLTPYFIITSLILSIIAAVISKNFAGFAHILSGIFVCAAPMAMLLTFPMPFYVSVKGLIKNGLTIAGWSGLYDIGKAKRLIVTDADLFPKGSIKIGKVCILSNMDAAMVISYAGSIINASGCTMSGPFASLMRKAGAELLPVDGFTVHESGGLRAMVDGKEVFCGDAAFMRLMGVVLPEKYVVRGGVYVAAAGAICGVFEVKYEAFDAVKDALAELMSSGRHAVFAVRDFNITPQMLSVKFDMPTDGFDFPPYAERYELSGAAPGEGSKPAALISREGLGALVSLADHGRSLFGRIRLCVMLSVMSAVIGIALMFILSLNALPGVTVPLIYLLAWLLVSAILSFTVSTP